MSADGASSARSIWPLLAFTCHPSLGRGAAHCIKRQARDNLIGDSLRQPFQGCILRRDGGIFGTHHVNARVRPGGSVEHNGALANFHELITGAERTPFTRDKSEEHTSELQSLMRISYAVFCLTKTKTPKKQRPK